jgi:hypothetical protein
MQIAEMRSALNVESQKRTACALPESMPDWAVRHAYERRNGLSLTPLPRGIEVRNAGSINLTSRVQRAKEIVQEHEARKTVTDEADRDHARLRVAVARLQ